MAFLLVSGTLKLRHTSGSTLAISSTWNTLCQILSWLASSHHSSHCSNVTPSGKASFTTLLNNAPSLPCHYPSYTPLGHPGLFSSGSCHYMKLYDFLPMWLLFVSTTHGNSMMSGALSDLLLNLQGLVLWQHIPETQRIFVEFISKFAKDLNYFTILIFF